MNNREMISIRSVLQLDFPVAREIKAMLAQDLYRIATSLFHKEIDPLFCTAQVVFQRLNIIAERGKDKTVICFCPQALQGQVGFINNPFVLIWLGNCPQSSV